MFLNAGDIRLLYLLCCRFPDRFIVALSKENGVKLGFRFERPQGNFSEDWQLRLQALACCDYSMVNYCTVVKL